MAFYLMAIDGIHFIISTCIFVVVALQEGPINIPLKNYDQIAFCPCFFFAPG